MLPVASIKITVKLRVMRTIPPTKAIICYHDILTVVIVKWWSGTMGWASEWVSQWARFHVPPDTIIGHFGDVPQANLLAWYGKKRNLTQQKHSFTTQKKCITTQNKHKKTKARFSRLHDIWPKNGEGLFLLWYFINFTYLHLPTRGVGRPTGDHRFALSVQVTMRLWASSSHPCAPVTKQYS